MGPPPRHQQLQPPRPISMRPLLLPLPLPRNTTIRPRSAMLRQTTAAPAPLLPLPPPPPPTPLRLPPLPPLQLAAAMLPVSSSSAATLNPCPEDDPTTTRLPGTLICTIGMHANTQVACSSDPQHYTLHMQINEDSSRSPLADCMQRIT